MEGIGEFDHYVYKNYGEIPYYLTADNLSVLCSFRPYRLFNSSGRKGPNSILSRPSQLKKASKKTSTTFTLSKLQATATIHAYFISLSYFLHVFNVKSKQQTKKRKEDFPREVFSFHGLFGNGSERQDLCTGAGNRNRHCRFSRICGYKASIQGAYLGIRALARFRSRPTFFKVFYIVS